MKSFDRKRVAVVGAGVVGLSTALRLAQSQQADQLDITLVSSEFSPSTTGDNAAGYIYTPFLVGGSKELLRELFKETFDFYLGLCRQGLDIGIGMMPGYHLYDSDPRFVEDYKDIFLDYHRLSPDQAQNLSNGRFKNGHSVLTLFVECAKLLPWALQQFQQRGGKVLQKAVESFEDLAEFDLVINCTGLGAKKLVNDPKLKPVRGQVHRVRAPWIKFALFAGDAYIIPNTNTVTLGGTKQEGNWDRTVDRKDQTRIHQQCTDLMPVLKHAEKVVDWVGLRPGRGDIRIEVDWTVLGSGKRLPIVHNYGHGGSGVSLAWGTAGKAIELVHCALNIQQAKL